MTKNDEKDIMISDSIGRNRSTMHLVCVVSLCRVINTLAGLDTGDSGYAELDKAFAEALVRMEQIAMYHNRCYEINEARNECLKQMAAELKGGVR